MRVVATIHGSERLTNKLEKLAAKLVRPVQQAVEAGAMLVESTAKRSIQQPGHGHVYEKYKPRRTHRASKPGDPPASDTGALVASIHRRGLADKLTYVVGTGLDYGLYLEFGAVIPTKAARGREGRMRKADIGGVLHPRPWLFPAFERNKRRIVKLINTAARKALGKGGK
jgi:hypothetical protein